MYGSFVCLCFVCHMHQASAPGGEPQETKTTLNHENQVAVSAALTYVIEFNNRDVKSWRRSAGQALVDGRVTIS